MLADFTVEPCIEVVAVNGQALELGRGTDYVSIDLLAHIPVLKYWFRPELYRTLTSSQKRPRLVGDCSPRRYLAIFTLCVSVCLCGLFFMLVNHLVSTLLASSTLYTNILLLLLPGFQLQAFYRS